MEEYREHDSIAVSATENQNIPVTAYQLAMAAFDRELADGKQTFNRNPRQQSVQQEYATYVMGALPSFDILGFWKVRYFYKT